MPHWKTFPFKRHPYADDRLPEMIVGISPQQTLLKYDLMTLCLVTFMLLNKETRFAPLFPGEFNSNDGQFRFLCALCMDHSVVNNIYALF